MFEATELLEDKKKSAGRETLFATVGPLSLYVRNLKAAGPLERELYKRVVNKVASALEAFGVPEELSKGKVAFAPHKSPIKGSIGEHDPKDDMPLIFDRNDQGILTYAKMTWTMTHEVGHRVWRRLPEDLREIFSGAVDFCGKRLSSDVLELMRDQAKSKDGKVILDKLHYRLFDSLWWTFKLSGSNDPDEFYAWIKEKKVTIELPTEYAQVNHKEAWAETFADLVLDRKKTKKNRRTGRFLRRVVRGIIDASRESREFKASDLS